MNSTPEELKEEPIPSEDAEPGFGHLVPVSTYRNVLSALLVLTVITVLVSKIDLGVFNILAAITIATIKAALVAAFFMHLKFERKLIIGFAVYPVIILALLIGGTLGDVATREPVQKGGETAPVR